MKHRFLYIMALLTAATGAWAQWFVGLSLTLRLERWKR